ncbi:hypothetical protein CYMTET_6332 [Cymbomonas tetramitiformis]|uniref:Uncharacterized protein n=1 Tax=Cymbomonas tetramitiformis TaxID=36881 RepID=A0AAE0LI53_9CHLO|nr:hypothetical protein CYMTET_6332 [Cymbomonas tetramitiformis]
MPSTETSEEKKLSELRRKLSELKAIDPLPFITTRDRFEGEEIYKEYGIVCGNAVHSRSIFVDGIVSLKSMFGGEVHLLRDLMERTTLDATRNLQKAAQEVGGNAVVCVRYSTSTTKERLSGGVITFVTAYGMAVRIR